MRQAHPVFTVSVAVVVLSNYLAQIPYYLYLYYFPHHAAPSVPGSLALLATLVWFVAGYGGLVRGRRAGYWLLLSFLVVEVGFYLHNMVIQVTHGYMPFFHLQSRDPLLFTVFAIGYLNLVAGIYFLYFLLRNRHTLLGTGVALRAERSR